MGFKILLAVAFPCLLFGQTRVQILDAESKVGVPFATVHSLSGNGVVTDSKGIFHLSDIATDTIIVSCLGYVSDTLLSVSLEKEILLKPLSIVLEPITITDESARPIRLGVSKKSSWSTFGVSNSYQIALYIPNADKKRFAVNEISLHVSPGFSGEEATKPINSFFRLRLYENNGGEPGNDILLQNVIIKPDKNKGWTEINVERYGILIPENGFFVAIEWLEETPAVEYVRKIDGKKQVRNDFGSSIKLHKAKGTEMKFMVSKEGKQWVDWKSLDMKHGQVTFPGIALNVIEF